MATTSTALVPLGDRDYMTKIIGRTASDKADVLNAVTVKEAQALSDAAIVVKSKSIGEAWQGGRSYLCQWLVSHFPIFDELAIRIHDRKRKGLSPLIIKGKPCSDFKEAIRLLLDTDPSYYYRLRKKHLGGGWQKRLPAEATAPETSVTEMKVDPEAGAQDAEVVQPDQPTVAGERVDKVHSAIPKPRRQPQPQPDEVVEAVVDDEPPSLATGGGLPAPMPSDEAVEEIHETADEPDQPLPVIDAEVARIHEAAAADTLPEVEDQVEAEQGQPEPPDPEGIWLDPKIVTPETVANFLNGVYAEKPGRHEAVRQMLKLLDKCVLWEISYASSEERSNRLSSYDTSAHHLYPSKAAEEVLKRGGFWSAKALIAEADIHVTWDSDPHGCGVSLDHFKKHVLGEMRHEGRLRTRMLGRVNWYCHPDHEAALKAAKKAEGAEFHCAEGELRKGAAPQPPLA